MSHYSAVVIIPINSKDIESAVNKILNPLSMNKKRSKYKVWDWWQYGGLWNGEMIGKPRDINNEGGGLEENHCLVKDIASGFFPYAVFAPDGNWSVLESGSYHEPSEAENIESIREMAEICKQYPDNIAVLVDYHS